MKKIITLFIINIMVPASYSFDEIKTWEVCNKELQCFNIKPGTDLFQTHLFKKTESEATYSTNVSINFFKKCQKKNDCWIFLGAVGDKCIVKFNNVIINNVLTYSHFESIKAYIPNNIILKKNNRIEILVTDLNQTQFGLRTKNTGIGTSDEVYKKSTLDWLLRTGSTILSIFTLFVIFLGILSAYSIYRDKRIWPLFLISFSSIFYLISFSEILRKYYDPIYLSGPTHFISRLLVDLSIVLVSLNFYKPHFKIKNLIYIPIIYLIPISIMIISALAGIHEYWHYKMIMLIAAPLVITGGLVLAILSYNYFDKNEKKIIFPLFIVLLCFQTYDLLVFWEILIGHFTVKWYLPFLVIIFVYIYIRRRITEVNLISKDALIGDKIRKIAHDICSPIERLQPLINNLQYESLEKKSLVIKNLEEIRAVTLNILENKFENKNNNTSISTILSDLKKKYHNLIDIEIHLWKIFTWFPINEEVFIRIFSNLINNAINANATQISFSGVIESGKIAINIIDNGNGIPAQLQPYIFEKGITSNQNSGSGLGLNYASNALLHENFHLLLISSKTNQTIFKIFSMINDFILIDDNPLQIYNWAQQTKEIGINLKTFYPHSFLENLNNISNKALIFIDQELGEFYSGFDLAIKLKNLGFKKIIITSGRSDIISSQFIQINKRLEII